MVKRKKVVTFDVYFEGGGSMIVRAPSAAEARSFAASAARKLAGEARKIVLIKRVIPVGFCRFVEARPL